MTQRERTEHLLDSLIAFIDPDGGYYSNPIGASNLVFEALADERRRALDEAAGCITEVRQAEMTGLNNMHYIDACDAILMRHQELYDKAQAGPEEGA